MIGRAIGPYEIVAPLGAGGMGEVYRARDTTLGRDVAIKILPSRFTGDSERRARFAREARLLATLNHPHIGAIYGLEDTDGVSALVLELVEGETLATRLQRGPLPLAQALAVARQIAEALDAAHEKGIVHRDLKPANIVLQDPFDRVSSGARVKVLDFGLAKTIEGGPDDARAKAATASFDGTADGRILGTPAYMSPEQARGLALDKRTDIWAFGCVLFEMLSGQQAFQGDTLTDTLARVLERDPEWASLPPKTPAHVRALLQRCLRKDPSKRLHDIADARTELEDTEATLARPQSSAEYVVNRLARHKLGAALTAGVLILAAAGGWWLASQPGTGPNEIPSVVVLPFSLIGTGDGYLADGITEAVTTELGRVGGLRVIASNTAFEYRNRTANREIAHELGVGLVLRGSVQRAGESVRIDVSLIDPRNDTSLWSQRYNGDMTNVLALQDGISTKIASALSHRFGLRAHATSPSRATRNPEASDAYLRGLFHLRGRVSLSQHTQGRAGERHLAVQLLEQAVALDPQFALARAALASAYTQRFFYDEADREFERAASQQIDRALEIDRDLAEAYLARAQLEWTAGNDFPHERAIINLQQAVSINPNLAQAYIELEKVYYHIGLTDKAVEANQRADRLDPSQAGSGSRAFRALVDARRLEEVQVELERTHNLSAYARGEALVAMGNLDEALQLLSTSSITDSNDTEYDVGGHALLGVVYARVNRREEAERVIATVKPSAENRTALSHLHHAQFNIGAALAWLGRDDEAVEWLTKAADQGYPSYPKFWMDQSLSPLKDHAGFGVLLARLRKDWEFWQKTL